VLQEKLVTVRAQLVVQVAARGVEGTDQSVPLSFLALGYRKATGRGFIRRQHA
jgi:hypothetical protein